MDTIYKNHRIVKGWLPLVRRVRSDLGLTEDQYSDDTVLAMITIESGGDPYNHRRGTQYYGLLQIGKSNGKEAEPDLIPVSLTKMTPEKAAETAIRHFFFVSEKYRKRHDYIPAKVAIGWKIGVNALLDYNAAEDAGASQAELRALLAAEHGGDAYLDRFNEALEFWKNNGERVVPEATRVEADFFTSAQAATLGISALTSMTVPFGCSRNTIASGGSAAPLLEARPATADTVRLQDARRATGKALAYIEGQYLQDLATYKEGAYVRYRTRNGYTEADYRRISAFVDSAQAGTYETAFRAVFDRAVVSWVKPLVNPTIGNSPWGKKRNFPARARSPGEARIILSDPDTGEALYRRHFGVDYATLKNGFGKNQECYSIDDGEVIRADESNTYGLVVFVLHEGGVTSRYAHLAEFRVKKGDRVTRGQVLGITGASEGNSSTTDRRGFVIVHDKLYPHLHFEVRINIGSLTDGKPVGGYSSNAYNVSIDPEPIFSVCPNPGELRERVNTQLTEALSVQVEASKALTSAGTANGRLEAAAAYNVAASFVRAAKLATASRREFYEAQLAANEVLVARTEQAVGVDTSTFEVIP